MKKNRSVSRFICFLSCLFFTTFSLQANVPLRLAIIAESSQYTVNTDMSFLSRGQCFFWVFSDSSDISRISEVSKSPLTQWSLYSQPRYLESYDTFDCYTRYLMAGNDGQEEDSTLMSGGGILPVGSRPVKETPRSRGNEDHLELRFFRWDGISSIYWNNTFVPAEWTAGKWILLVTLREGIQKTDAMLRFQTQLTDFISPSWYENSGKITFSSWEVYSLGGEMAVIAGSADFLMKDRTVPVPLEVVKRKKEFQDIFKQELATRAPAITYSWDIGSSARYKCEFCTGAPPRFDDIARLQYHPGDMPVHYYFTRIDGTLPARWKIETKAFSAYQVIFEGTHSSTGFLDCPQKQEYLKSVRIREEKELQSLELLVGKNKSLIFRKKED